MNMRLEQHSRMPSIREKALLVGTWSVSILVGLKQPTPCALLSLLRSPPWKARPEPNADFEVD